MRHYRIERDASGVPCRMLWLGDTPAQFNVRYMRCPRCQSQRWQAGQCLACWYAAPRNWNEWAIDPVIGPDRVVQP